MKKRILTILGTRPELIKMFPLVNKLDKKSGDLASIFHYLLHNIYLFDYPYDKPSDMLKTSPDELPKFKNFERFKNTFDVLSMDQEEWKKELINIYSKILKQKLN